MKIDTTPETFHPEERERPLPERRPATPKILPARRAYRVLLGLMVLVPQAVAAAAIAIALR